MNNIGKIAAAIIGIAVVGLVAAGLSGVLNNDNTFDEGIDVSGTACEEIGAARAAVDAELQTRKDQAAQDLADALETNSDNFWDENRRLETVHNDCITAALLEDPCKALFEQGHALAQAILNGVNNGQGFDEDLFDQREQVKKDYDECVAKANKDEFFDAAKLACDSALAAGQQANEETRTAADEAAQNAHDVAVTAYEAAASQKHGTLNAIEEKCNESGGTTSVGIGGLTTGGTGTLISSGSACSGNFSGNDEDLEAQLRLLENQLQKARAAGLTGGLYGSDHLMVAVDEARQALKDSERTCETDADCGDPEPVCCSGTSVGRVFCDGGTCANEITECVDPEICAGKPAECVDPTTGAGQTSGVYIERTIPEVGSCSQNLQTLDLQQASPDSVRYEITGNIPSWVTIDRPGGSLPASVNVTYSCNTVQGFGPGTYTADGAITVYNANGDLINTIPFNISVTVEPAQADTSQASAVSISPSNLQFVYNHASPTCPLPAGAVNIDGPAGSTWLIGSNLPVWLTSASGSSGNVPASVQLQFPCQLDSYTDQSQSTNVQFIVTTPDGQTQSVNVGVQGEFTNFGGAPEVEVPEVELEIRVEDLERLL